MIRHTNLLSLIYHFLFAVSGSIVGAIIASWPLLFIFMVVQKTNEIVKMSVFKVMHNYNQLMIYLLWPLQDRLRMSNFPTSVSAAVHFAQCKHLFLVVNLVFILCWLMFFVAKQEHNRSFLLLDKSWALLLLVLPILILPFALTNFDSFFIAFHHLLFNNNDWLFNPLTDPIINVLTEGFFAACFAVAGVIYELYFAASLLRH